nr:uncharacterized protein LOC123768467 isoform X2 [Procambarus clarkii]
MDHEDKLEFFPNGVSGPCSRCGKFSPGPEHLLYCSQCQGLVHIECLNSKPRCLLVGDNFYTLTCLKCSSNKEDFVVRPKFLSRLQALVMVLFHLHKTSTESSCQGFFHVEDHISEFFIGYWEDIFGSNSNIKKRGADGRGILAGLQDVLLQHPQYFVKGPESLGDGEWYKLSAIKPPAQLLHTNSCLDSKTNDSPKPSPLKKGMSSLSEDFTITDPTDEIIIGSNNESPGQVTVKQEPEYKEEEEVFVAEFTGEDESSVDPFADIDGDQTIMPSAILSDDVTHSAAENLNEFSSSQLVKVFSEKPSRLIKPKVISAPQPQIISSDGPNNIECVGDNDRDVRVTRHFDSSWHLVEDMLPGMFSHKVINYEYIPEISLPGFNMIADSTVSTKEDILLWLREFSKRTQTCWMPRACVMGSSYPITHRAMYVCLGSSKTEKDKSRVTPRCKAFINIKLYERDILREVNNRSAGFLSRISLSYVHNHSVMFKEALQYKSVKKEIVEMFRKYFCEGNSATSAHHYHEARLWLRDSASQLLIDNSINPKIQTIKYMREHWGKQNAATVKNTKVHGKGGDTLFNAVCEKVEELSRERKVQYFIVKVPFSVALVTPMMKRVHSIPEASLIMFANTVNGCGEDRCSITYFMCASVAGVLPLGVVIVSNPTCSAFKVAFRNLVTTIGETAFGGRGSPMVIISDGFEPQRDALKNCFPFSHVLLCVTHLVRSVWRWLTEDSNHIKENHRVTLMNLVKNVLYASSPDESILSYKVLLEDSTSKQYKVFHTYLATLWYRRSEVGLVYKLPINNKDFIELSRRTFIDAILTKCQAFNTLPMMNYVCIAVEECFQSRISEFIENTASQLTFLKCMDGNILPETNTVKSSYKVRSLHDEETWFTVDCEASVCSCLSGGLGGLCEHQRAVWKMQNTQLPSPPEIDAAGKLQLAEIAFGEVGYQSFNRTEYDFTIKALKKNLARLETIASQNITNSFIGKMKQMNQALEKITSLNELGTFCEVVANSQAHMQISLNILPPQTNLVQPQANIVQPQANMVQSHTNMMQPQPNLVQPHSNIAQTQASIVQPQTTFIQPQVNVVHTRASFARSQTSLVQAQTNLLQAQNNIVQTQTSLVQQQTGLVQPHASLIQPQASIGQSQVNIVQPQTSIIQPQTRTRINPIQFLVVQPINKC